MLLNGQQHRSEDMATGQATGLKAGGRGADRGEEEGACGRTARCRGQAGNNFKVILQYLNSVHGKIKTNVLFST